MNIVNVYLFQGRLKDIRMKRGITAQQIADKLNIARSTYSGYERGHRSPTIETIAQIAQILDTSTDYLLLLTDDPAPKDPDHNISNYLKETDLHFDGTPLTPEELKPLREFLGLIASKKKVTNKLIV